MPIVFLRGRIQETLAAFTRHHFAIRRADDAFLARPLHATRVDAVVVVQKRLHTFRAPAQRARRRRGGVAKVDPLVNARNVECIVAARHVVQLAGAQHGLIAHWAWSAL